jgi:hypothetical protein
MQESIARIESRARFIAKVSAVYLIYAAVCAAFAWYMLYHNPAIRWVIVGVALMCLLGVFSWFWTMQVQLQRYRVRTKAFYSMLAAEISQARNNAAEAATTQSHAPCETVTVIMRMYTMRQTAELALMAMYQTPRNALVLAILSLVPFGLLFNNWPLSIPGLISALAAAIVLNGIFVAIVSTGMRRSFKKLWKGRSEAVVIISNRGLEISQDAQSGSVLPWTSIDRVRESGSWMLFMRDRRRIVALPIDRIPEQGLGQLREILKTAKGQLANLHSR